MPHLRLGVMHSMLDLRQCNSELLGNGVAGAGDKALHGVQRPDLCTPFSLFQYFLESAKDDTGGFRREQLQNGLGGGGSSGAHNVALVHV